MDDRKIEGTFERALGKTGIEGRLHRLANGTPGVDRRGFVKGMVLALAVVPLIGFLQACKGESEAPPAGMTAVDPETDPTAKALGYHPDASTVDPAKWPKRSGPEAQTQNCNTCSFYTAQNGQWGKCTLLPNGVVKGEGWCNSWTPKA